MHQSAFFLAVRRACGTLVLLRETPASGFGFGATGPACSRGQPAAQIELVGECVPRPLARIDASACDVACHRWPQGIAGRASRQQSPQASPRLGGCTGWALTCSASTVVMCGDVLIPERPTFLPWRTRVQRATAGRGGERRDRCRSLGCGGLRHGVSFHSRLPERWRRGAALNALDPSAFYSPGLLG